MATKGSADVAFILLGGRSIMGRVTEFSDSLEALTEETTPLGVAYDTPGAVGQKKWELQQNGFYDTEIGAILEAYELSGAQNLMYGLEGNEIGADFLGCSAIRTTIERMAERGTLHKANASFVSAGEHDEGKVGAHLVARTTAGPTSTATLDWGVAYANQITGKIVAYIGVTDLVLGGATALQVKVRDSDDDITYADVITFTAVTAAPDSDRQEVAAAAVPNDIERYTQVQWQFTGTPGGSQTATFAVGISRPLT